jgi:hypothetical protein
LIEKIGAAVNISNDVQSYVVRNFKVVLHFHSIPIALRGRFISCMLNSTNVAPMTHAQSFELG